jgi:hypothetical protein
MVKIPYMTSRLIYHSKVHLVHRHFDIIAIAELKIWKVPDKDYDRGIKYSLYLVNQRDGKVIVGYDNHKPKGHHFHIEDKESKYEFIDIQRLIDDFWKQVKKAGFIYET